MEREVLDGLASVDVALEKDEQRVACEISVTTPPEHELGNVQKCLAAGFDHVAVVSAERKTLRHLRAQLDAALPEDQKASVRCLTPEELFAILEELGAIAASKEDTVRGYKVKVKYKSVGEDEKESRPQAISQVIVKPFKRLGGG